MLNPSLMHLSHLLFFFVVLLSLQIERDVLENGIFLYNLIKDIDVERELFNVVQVLNQLLAQRAPHSVVLEQLTEAVGAEGVASVHKNSWNSLSYIVLICTELAKIQSPRFVVHIYVNQFE